MAKVSIQIGGGGGDGEDMGEDFASGAMDFKDRVIAAVGMYDPKSYDGKTVHEEILSMIEDMPCGHDRMSAPPSSPSGAGMGDMGEDMGEDY